MGSRSLGEMSWRSAIKPGSFLSSTIDYPPPDPLLFSHISCEAPSTWQAWDHTCTAFML